MSRSIEEALEVLGVAADSDPATVAHAYRRLARATHPDVSAEPDAAQRFAAVAAAYRLVADRARIEPPAVPSPEAGREAAAAPADAVWWWPVTSSVAHWGPRPVGWPTAIDGLVPSRTVLGGSQFGPARLRDGTAIVAGPVMVQPSRPGPATDTTGNGAG